MEFMSLKRVKFILGSGWTAGRGITSWAADQRPERAEKLGSTRPETDYFSLKGAIEDLFFYLGYEAPAFEPEDHSFFESGQSVKILTKNETAGYLGLLKPEIRKAYELEKLAYACELNLAALFDRQPRAFVFAPVPRYPGMVRDLSFLVEAQVNFQAIDVQLKKLNVPYLERFEIYDRFEGGSLPAGQISLILFVSFSGMSPGLFWPKKLTGQC